MELINSLANEALPLFLNIIMLFSEGYSRRACAFSWKSTLPSHQSCFSHCVNITRYCKVQFRIGIPSSGCGVFKEENQTNLFNSVSKKKWTIDKAIYFE